jgi:hypothetical protein
MLASAVAIAMACSSYSTEEAPATNADAGPDASDVHDAAPSDDARVRSFCEGQTDAAFCEDFTTLPVPPKWPASSVSFGALSLSDGGPPTSLPSALDVHLAAPMITGGATISTTLDAGISQIACRFALYLMPNDGGYASPVDIFAFAVGGGGTSTIAGANVFFRVQISQKLEIVEFSVPVGDSGAGAVLAQGSTPVEFGRWLPATFDLAFTADGAGQVSLVVGGALVGSASAHVSKPPTSVGVRLGLHTDYGATAEALYDDLVCTTSP